MKFYLVLSGFLFFAHFFAAGQSTNNCLDLVVDIRDWKESTQQNWDFFKATSAGAGLCYIGAEHSDQLSHAQFKNIQQQFKACKPTIVFFEGPDRGIAASDTATIRLFGESGYSRWLAKSAGIPTRSLEPSFADLYAYLLTKYPQEQVDLYMLTKEASRLHYRKKMAEGELLETIGNMMKQVAKMTGVNKPLLTSLGMIDSAYAKHFSTAYKWWQVPQQFFDPAKKSDKSFFTNELAALSSAYRNIYMVQLLAQEVNAGQKVFAVVGRNHVPLQAAALDCAITGSK